MQISDRVLSRRYAAALYQWAARRGEGEQAAAALGTAQRALSDAMARLKNPRVPAAEKKALIQRALEGKVSAGVLRFLEFLVDKKRLHLLAHLAGDIGRVSDEARGLARASVRAAQELSPSEAKALREALERFSAKTVVLDVRVDPELLGGAVVRLGDWVLDGSVAGRLRRLKAHWTA